MRLPAGWSSDGRDGTLARPGMFATGCTSGHGTSCGVDRPVERVAWHMAAVCVNALSHAAGLDAFYASSGSGSGGLCSPPANPYGREGWRLPAETEWEYGARCATGVARHPASVTGAPVAWFDANGGGTTHPVGTKPDNGRGLYDMGGNIRELESDHATTRTSNATDPCGTSSSAGGSARGGSAYIPGSAARTTQRSPGIF
jgi:formylglycine-generating enzyme required for sulfatase activity